MKSNWTYYTDVNSLEEALARGEAERIDFLKKDIAALEQGIKEDPKNKDYIRKLAAHRKELEIRLKPKTNETLQQ